MLITWSSGGSDKEMDESPMDVNCANETWTKWQPGADIILKYGISSESFFNFH